MGSLKEKKCMMVVDDKGNNEQSKKQIGKKREGSLYKIKHHSFAITFSIGM